jgi:phage shock protein PspC (stress-responsive transcriptional regulator)
MLYKKHLDGELAADGVDDRAYRLVKNSGQVLVDKYSLVGGGVGATYGAIFGGLGVRSVFSGTMTGVAFGVAAYAIQQYAIPRINEQLK